MRRWFLKFGSTIAAILRRTRPGSSNHWHLDEMVIVIRRERYWLWRAVDNEGGFWISSSKDGATPKPQES